MSAAIDTSPLAFRKIFKDIFFSAVYIIHVNDQHDRRHPASLPSIGVNNLVLVDVFEYVRSIHENADSAGGGDGEENVQLEPIDHHGYVLPVFTNLQGKENKW